jgi:hypothetical protein
VPHDGRAIDVAQNVCGQEVDEGMDDQRHCM